MQFLISNRVNAIDTHKKRIYGIDERETRPVKLLIGRSDENKHKIMRLYMGY